MPAADAKTVADKSDERQDDKNVSHGNHEGLDFMHVKLISSDYHEFIVKREEAMVSGIISAILSSPEFSVERQINVIRFTNIRSDILKIVCEYFIYARRYENSSTAIHDFSIPPELSVELFFTSTILEC